MLKSFLAILVSTSVIAGSHWDRFRGNEFNTGILEKDISSFTAELENRSLWTYKTNGLIWATAVHDPEGNIYIGSVDKKLYSLDKSGSLRWSYELFDRADSLIDSASLYYDSSLVVAPGGDGFLHGVDPKTGQRKWVFEADGVDENSHQGGVIVNSFEGNVTKGPNGLIYAGSDNGYMYAVDKEGNKKWAYRTEMMIWSSPAFANSTDETQWMIFGSLDKKLHLVDQNTGKEIDVFNARAEIKASPLVEYQNGVAYIYVGDAQGDFYKFKIKKKKNGELKLEKVWRKNVGQEIYGSATIDESKVYVGSLNGNFYAFDKSKGKKQWVYRTYSTISSSPIRTGNNLIFGARNGKMYVLNSNTGERVYSFKTQESVVKSNLDASPMVTQDGYIINGAYSGIVYGIPFEYCLKNNSDSRCEYEGSEDIPQVVQGLEDGTYFYNITRDGIISDEAKNLDLTAPIQLKLIAIKNGKYRSKAAINPLGLKVRLNGEKVKFRVSSDGEFLNILPNPSFSSKDSGTLEIRGTYYNKTHWLMDRSKYLFLPKIRASISLEFNSESDKSSEAFEGLFDSDKVVGIRSMYLFQPKSLETYIPAAMDGQYFVMKMFDLNPDTNEFFALVKPASFNNGVFSEMKADNKTFILKGIKAGNELKMSGTFKLSAMGGTIPFNKANFNIKLDGERIKNGLMHVEANCLGIEGNGEEFSFAPAIIFETCDHKLRMIGLGRFDAQTQSFASGLNISVEDKLISIQGAAEVGGQLSVIHKTSDETKLLSSEFIEKGSEISVNLESVEIGEVFIIFGGKVEKIKL